MSGHVQMTSIDTWSDQQSMYETSQTWFNKHNLIKTTQMFCKLEQVKQVFTANLTWRESAGLTFANGNCVQLAVRARTHNGETLHVLLVKNRLEIDCFSKLGVTLARFLGGKIFQVGLLLLLHFHLIYAVLTLLHSIWLYKERWDLWL